MQERFNKDLEEKKKSQYICMSPCVYMMDFLQERNQKAEFLGYNIGILNFKKYQSCSPKCINLHIHLIFGKTNTII